MYRRLLSLILFVSMAVTSLSADPLQVDLSQSGDVEAGWIDWNTGGTRLGNSDVSRQFLNEAAFDDDFTIDFVKIDSRNRGQVSDSIPLHDLLDDCFKDSSAFDMVIKGLAPGVYVITSYHHDENEDVVNDDGTINITVTDADGTRVAVDHLQQSWGPNPTFVGIATFTFRSNGTSDVVITFEDNNDGIHNEAHLNGFEMDTLRKPSLASDPNPPDGAKDVPRDVTLRWRPGDFAPAANGHALYLSDNLDDVNDDVGGTTLSDSSYSPPERLELETAYYWRVDEVNGAPDFSVHPGEIWSFETEPVGFPIATVTATASSSMPNQGPENTVNGSGLTDGLHAMESNTMWLSELADPQPTWIQFEFDKVYVLHEMRVWNSNTEFETSIGYGAREVSIEYSMDGLDYLTLGTTHELNRAPADPDYAYNTAIDFGGLAARFVRITINSNWGGFIPQFGLSEVRFFHIPLRARLPQPESGQIDVHADVTLIWRAGRQAAEHNVYVSTDEQVVIDGTAPVTVAAETSYSPPSLDLGRTYYWKIDEVNTVETPPMLPANVWNFTTQDYRVVDDFESYNDVAAGEEGSNLVYMTWIDGFDNPTANGSTMGYTVPFEPTMESSIVHGGQQSAPVEYNNTGAALSEVTRTFAPQDWTRHGIQTLTLWFHGTAGNTGQLYVKVNGAKVSYPGNATDIARPRWTQWNIDLASVASLGVNVANVTTLALGIEGVGAAGTLYIDDIVLYRLAPEVVVGSEEIWIEAEAADTISAPMQIYDDPGASGGKYIGTTDDVGDSSNSPPLNGVATYSFAVQGGVYKVSCRIIIPGGDSFWVRIPGAVDLAPGENPNNPGTGWVRWGDPPDSNVWYWHDVFSGDHDEQTANWTLPAGSYTLQIARREDGALVDVIVISKVG